MPLTHFQLVVIQRITEHKEKETVRFEAERARIRAEEQAAAAELSAAHALPVLVHFSAAGQTGRQAVGAPRFAAVPPEPVKLSATKLQIPMVAMTGGALEFRLDQIETRLGFSLTAEFLCQLGVEDALDRASGRYRAHDFSKLCTALIHHIGQVQAQVGQPDNGRPSSTVNRTGQPYPNPFA